MTNQAEELIADLEAEIAKRDARIAELEQSCGDLRVKLAYEEGRKQPRAGAIHIVFDGPPGPVCGRFVEAEDAAGRSINAGEWSQRADGYWQLVIQQPRDEVARLNPPGECAAVLPDNLMSHRGPWLDALDRLVELEPTSSDPESCHFGHREYWMHERKAMRDMYADLDRLNPCRAQAVQVNHDSDCSTNNHGVPELLGPCDCSASKDK